MQTSLIITTYNAPEQLAWCLASVCGQTIMPNQVIVADDGSKPSSRHVVERWREYLPIEYIWIPDSDFRVCRSRNLALLRVRYPHFVLIDGDCLIPPKFVEMHQRLAEAGKIIAGGRHLLSRAETEALFEKPNAASEIDFSHWKFRRCDLKFVRDLQPHGWWHVRTCNIGLMTEDVRCVGGFDESFIGWGREDSDFVVRLLHHGCAIRSARLAACVLHLFHEEVERDRLSINEEKLKETIRETSRFLPRQSCLIEPSECAR